MADDLPIPTELARWMARIETKLDTVISGHDDHEKRMRALESQATEQRDHEARLAALESNRWPMQSISTLISAIAMIAAIAATILSVRH